MNKPNVKSGVEYVGLLESIELCLCIF